MTEELKRCRDCGRSFGYFYMPQATRESIHYGKFKGWGIKCPDCNYCTGILPTKEKAIQAWENGA